MLDPIAKAITPLPGIDQLPSADEARALLARVHATAPDRPKAAPRQADLGIPARFADADLEAWPTASEQQAKVLAIVQRFARNFAKARELGSNLVFRGNIGAGKTTLACATVRAVHAAGYSARYTRLGAHFRRMREAFSGEGKPASSIEAQLALVDLLVLDEVGVQYGSKAELVMLTELIDERYGAKRPTIVVSNLGSAQLTDMVGERAADRLVEKGVDLLFDWPSFRRRGEGST